MCWEVFSQSKVKKASQTYFSPKSFFFYGSYNIVPTNNKNFLSKSIRSTLNMELLVKSAVTKQLANYHNAEPPGAHRFIHSPSIYGSKCRTNRQLIYWWRLIYNPIMIVQCINTTRVCTGNVLGVPLRALASHPSFFYAFSSPKGLLYCPLYFHNSVIFVNVHHVNKTTLLKFHVFRGYYLFNTEVR